MPTVTYGSNSYECSTAIKGESYIHLMDSNGNAITTFAGISDFSAFAITDGEWTEAKQTEQCEIAVIGEGGGIRKSARALGDIPNIVIDSIPPEEVTTLNEGDIYIYLPTE